MTKADYMSEEEVAEFLGLKVSTLRKKRYTDLDHPPYIKVGARVFYPRKEFFSWFNGKVSRESLASSR